jgi:hypothetical protein
MTLIHPKQQDYHSYQRGTLKKTREDSPEAREKEEGKQEELEDKH